MVRELNNLGSLAMILVFVGLLLALNVYVVGQVRTQINDTNSTNILNQVLNALAIIPQWLPLIVIVVMVGLIIGIFLSVFGGRRGVR